MKTAKVFIYIIIVDILLLISGCRPAKELPPGWHHNDLDKDGLYGISLEKAYEVIKGKKSQTVIVAVIDSGIDTTHEDLKDVLWKNPKETPGNGIDDDKNGYIDDVFGWNFIGGAEGKNVNEDSYEAMRVYHKFKGEFKHLKSTQNLTSEKLEKYNLWKQAKSEVLELKKSYNGIAMYIIKALQRRAIKNDSILRVALGEEIYKGVNLEQYTPKNKIQEKAKAAMMTYFESDNSMQLNNKIILEEFTSYVYSEEKKLKAIMKAPQNYRSAIVKDDEASINNRSYGNNDVMSTTASHGTHVAGIIAAVRNNKIGINGIADNVKIMCIRAVPDGDEHDKDVALSIKYAVDNGAQIINMSFGKRLSPDKAWVDEAVAYAEKKGVLLVHAAGNEGSDNDKSNIFPNPNFKSTGYRAGTWITVGASGNKSSGGILASFSNYGKNEVDVFAPGVKIYSTLPITNSYGNADGTSMAAPVVSGLAAFILSYYPYLTAHQVKQIIEESTVEVPAMVLKRRKSFKDLSKTGGIINAYTAISKAEELSKYSTGLSK